MWRWLTTAFRPPPCPLWDLIRDIEDCRAQLARVRRLVAHLPATAADRDSVVAPVCEDLMQIEHRLQRQVMAKVFELQAWYRVSSLWW